MDPATARAAAARTGARGASIGPDYTAWQYWWEYHKHRFLRLRDAVHSTTATTGSAEFFMGGSRTQSPTLGPRPTDRQLVDDILPLLERALAQPDDRDITTAALMALAKLRVPAMERRILELIRGKLDSPLLVVRETAALALGVAQSATAVPTLAALATDSARGRRITNLPKVGARERAFACYGLGLIGNESERSEVKSAVFSALESVLETEPAWDVHVAAIQGIRLLVPELGERSYKAWSLVSRCADTLAAELDADRGPGHFVVQAHIPTAIAAAIGPDSPLAGKFKQQFLDELKDGTTRRALITQSCAIALGMLSRPDDREVSMALRRYYESGKDQQTRFFCLIAMAEIGGDENRTALLKALDRGNKAIEKPWCALALGVLAFEQRQTEGATIDTTLGRALHHQFGETKNDPARGALAIGLGLTGYRDAEEDLRRVMTTRRDRDELASHLAIGLALMGATNSADAIHSIAETSVRRPMRLLHTSIALAALADRRIAETLTQNLTQERPALATLAATASALGFVGDSDTITPLVGLASDPSLSDLGRAFAIAALGSVADRQRFPWHLAISSNMNYRANVATLADGSTGILDLL